MDSEENAIVYGTFCPYQQHGSSSSRYMVQIIQVPHPIKGILIFIHLLSFISYYFLFFSFLFLSFLYHLVQRFLLTVRYRTPERSYRSSRKDITTPFKLYFQKSSSILIFSSVCTNTTKNLLILLILIIDHHRWGNIENRRRFFENYAKKNGLDPHKPESWYSLSRKKLASIKVFFWLHLSLFLIRFICLICFVYFSSTSCFTSCSYISTGVSEDPALPQIQLV